MSRIRSSEICPEHVWGLVSEEDELETEVCTNCGAQRDKTGKKLPRAWITGGWPYEAPAGDVLRGMEEPESLRKVLDAAQRWANELLGQASKYESLNQQDIADLTHREHFQPLQAAIDVWERECDLLEKARDEREGDA